MDQVSSLVDQQRAAHRGGAPFHQCVPGLVSRRSTEHRSRQKRFFFLYLFGIVAANVNAFVHAQHAYATISQGLWLSIRTVALMVVGNLLAALQYSSNGNKRRA
jgi:hypothetical protein